eukprot:424624_1
MDQAMTGVSSETCMFLPDICKSKGRHMSRSRVSFDEGCFWLAVSMVNTVFLCVVSVGFSRRRRGRVRFGDVNSFYGLLFDDSTMGIDHGMMGVLSKEFDDSKSKCRRKRVRFVDDVSVIVSDKCKRSVSVSDGACMNITIRNVDDSDGDALMLESDSGANNDGLSALTKKSIKERTLATGKAHGRGVREVSE